jgi:1-acyl-sn-glycerol-3-phosphate acyltransferase
VIYALMRALMRTLVTVYLAGLFTAVGVENIPRTGPLLICPNHSATLDPPLVPAFVPREDTWSMAKSEFFRNPFIAFIYGSYHSFPVVRHTADRAALKRTFDLLKAGHSVIIYPEGTRVESGLLAQPEPGAGFIAQKAGCPVLPVGLTGTRECLPKGARWPRRTKVTITFGKPFVVLTKRADGSRVTHNEASDAVMLAIAELLPPEQRGVFSDLDSYRKKLAGVTRLI